MSVNPIREGFHTITPYLAVNQAAELIEFLKNAFDAEQTHFGRRPDGSIMHAELRIGDSMVMIGEATKEFGPMPTNIYLYVTECDVVYKQALEAGGQSIFEPTDMPSGERYGGVKDPCDNVWWVATHFEDVTPEEEQQRWKDWRG